MQTNTPPEPRPIFGRLSADATRQQRVIPDSLAPAARARLLARLEEEARLLESLAHPGVPRVAAVDLSPPEDSARGASISLRLLKGVRLSEVIAAIHGEHARGRMGMAGGEPWSFTGALKVFVRLAETIAFAHSNEVVHRGIDARRVVVGHFGEVQLLDWHLARDLRRADLHDLSPAVGPAQGATTSRGADRTQLPTGDCVRTVDGDPLAHASYLAPELIGDRQYDVGKRSDVYALGAILYHLLAGFPPHARRGEVVLEAELWRRAQSSPPLSLRRAAPRAPRSLARVAERALNTQRHLRQADAREFLLEIEEALANGFATTGPIVGLTQWAKEHRVAAATLLIGMGLLVGRAFQGDNARQVSAASSNGSDPTVQSRVPLGAEPTGSTRPAREGAASVAVPEPGHQAEPRAGIRGGLRSDFVEYDGPPRPQLTESAPDAARTELEPSRAKPLDSTQEQDDTSAEVEAPSLHSAPGADSGSATMGIPVDGAPTQEPAHDPSRTALATPTSFVSTVAPSEAATPGPGTAIANASEVAGEHGAGRDGAGEDGLESENARALEQSSSLRLRAETARDGGRWSEAAELFCELYRAEREALGEGHEGTLRTRRELAVCLTENGDGEAALIHYLGCLALHTGRDELALDLQRGYAELLLTLGERSEGERRLQESAELAAELRGPGSPLVTQLYDQLAASAFRFGELDRVAAAFERGLDARLVAAETSSDPDQRDVMSQRSMLVQIYQRLERSPDALRHARALLEATPVDHAARPARAALVSSLEAKLESN